MHAFRVIDAGPLTTVQDAGRPGLRRYGIPPSGAMDQFAYRVANLLAGNPEDAPALEAMFPGLALEALADTTVSVTGADLDAHIDNRPAPLWAAVRLSRGSRLELRSLRSGCRAYVAAAGGFEAPRLLGSRSTFLKGRIGSPVQTGDGLEAAAAPTHPPCRALPADLMRPLPATYAIRVILGPQTDYFTERGLATFQRTEYTVSPKSDRQGVRTEGQPIETVKGSDIITDPTPLGAVQVPGDGQPIILLRDGQSTGGYAKIATVISADLDWFGQMVAGDTLRFCAVTRDEALESARGYRGRLDLIAARLALKQD